MLFRNEKLDQAFSFIKESELDFFCLQEVPETFLTRLKTLPYHVTYRIDADRLFEEGISRSFNVILSRHPISMQGDIPYPNYWSRLPWRVKVFVRGMRFMSFSKIENRGGMYIDALVGNTSVRVFNLHLILAHPTLRSTEFETAMQHLDPARPTIICGDFNILESLEISILNWLSGGTIFDAIFFWRERRKTEKRFRALGLRNLLRGSVTHSFSRSQLDHILITKEFTTKNAEVIPQVFGSDHHPVTAELRESFDIS